jgi:hypothetical protein
LVLPGQDSAESAGGMSTVAVMGVAAAFVEGAVSVTWGSRLPLPSSRREQACASYRPRCTVSGGAGGDPVREGSTRRRLIPCQIDILTAHFYWGASLPGRNGDLRFFKFYVQPHPKRVLRGLSHPAWGPNSDHGCRSLGIDWPNARNSATYQRPNQRRGQFEPLDLKPPCQPVPPEAILTMSNRAIAPIAALMIGAAIPTPS